MLVLDQGCPDRGPKLVRSGPMVRKIRTEIFGPVRWYGFSVPIFLVRSGGTDFPYRYLWSGPVVLKIRTNLVRGTENPYRSGLVRGPDWSEVRIGQWYGFLKIFKKFQKISMKPRLYFQIFRMDSVKPRLFSKIFRMNSMKPKLHFQIFRVNSVKPRLYFQIFRMNSVKPRLFSSIFRMNSMKLGLYSQIFRMNSVKPKLYSEILRMNSYTVFQKGNR